MGLTISTPQVSSPGGLELISGHMTDASLPGNLISLTSFALPLGTLPLEDMQTDDEVRAALSVAVGSFRDGADSSSTVRRGPSRRATRSGLSGGVGSARSTRPLANVSPNSDLGIVSGFIADACFFR